MTNSNLRLWAEFDLDVDIEKAGEAEKAGRGRIRGIVSSEKKDADGEVILQDGLDFSWFKTHGFFTLEHPLNAMNVIGEPVELQKTTIGDGIAATEVVGELYLKDPVALGVWRKAVAIKKSGGQRRLGMSIEGRVLQRDGNVIQRAEVRSVAISPQPRNEDSWFEPLAASQMGMPSNMMMQMMPFLAAMTAMKGPGAGYGPEMGNVGYPKHSQNIEGGISTLVKQSIDPSNASAAMDRKAFMRMMDARDKLVMRVLKKFPYLTWSQGLAALEEAQTKLKLEGMEHEGK